MKLNRLITSQLAGTLAIVCFALSATAGTPPNAQSDNNTAATAKAQVAVGENKVLSDSAKSQISAIKADKAAWTSAQRKISSAFIYAARVAAGKPAVAGVPSLQATVDVDGAGKTAVEVHARVSPEVIALIQSFGGEVSASYPELKTISAKMPLANIEGLAGDERILAIRMPKLPTLENVQKAPLAQSDLESRVSEKLIAAVNTLRDGGVRAPLAASVPTANASTVGDFRNATPEGDYRHRSRAARIAFGIDGTGIKIGVMSDSFNRLGGAAANVASGDLPGPGNPNGYTLPVQYAGSGEYTGNNPAPTDEGRAMCQIVHAILPGAQIYFANAFTSDADFANNIRALRGISTSPGASGNVPGGGCDIIVDDVSYSQEAVLRDGVTAGVDSPSGFGVIKQAVNDVTANGALYFSSAANSGNLNDAQSGTWEGDFVDGGAATGPLAGAGHAHNWNSGGTADTTNSITASGTYVELEWSDPAGASTNDYDLVTLNAAGTSVIGLSADAQDGTQDPTEAIYPGQNGTAASANAGAQVVVLKADTAEVRFISVATGRARLQYGTQGQVRGHNCAPAAFAVAATPTSTSVGPTFPAPFGPTNMVETFSSDGPRRVFFDENNFAYNGLSLASGGGIVRQKPDLTAADGAPTSGVGPNFDRFFGTSAAAPHAAAISGLVKLAFKKAGITNPRMTQIRGVMQSTATDIETPGVDRDAGYGVVDAFAAVQATHAAGGAGLDRGTVTMTEIAGSSNGNGKIEPGEAAALNIPLVNVGINTASNVVATLSTSTPGVVILSGSRNYGDIAAGATASPSQPFSFSLDPSFACSSPIKFQLVLNYAGAAAGVTPETQNFSVITGQSELPQFFTVLDTTPPPANPLYTAATGTEVNRVAGNGIVSACGSMKAFPGLNGTVAPRRYDSYTFTNAGAGRCITVTYNPPHGTAATGNFVGCAAYSSFDPNNPQNNYLADAGSNYVSNPGGYADVSYSFNAPSNGTFTIVIFESTSGATQTGSDPDIRTYGLRLSGLAICQAYNGSTQEDVSELAPVAINSSSFTASSCTASGYSNDIVINGTVMNNSSYTMHNVVFKVATLSNRSGGAGSPPYRLATADEAVGNCDTTKGGVGSTQTGPVTLAPGQSIPVQFIINAPSTAPYRFGVRTLATVSSSGAAPASTESRIAHAVPVYSSPFLTALVKRDSSFVPLRDSEFQ